MLVHSAASLNTLICEIFMLFQHKASSRVIPISTFLILPCFHLLWDFCGSEPEGSAASCELGDVFLFMICFTSPCIWLTRGLALARLTAFSRPGSKSHVGNEEIKAKYEQPFQHRLERHIQLSSVIIIIGNLTSSEV